MTTPAGFDFLSVPKVLFGRGRVVELGNLAAGMGSEALLVSNVCRLPASGTPPGRAAERLSTAGLCAMWCPVAGEPTVESVAWALDMARRHDCDVVVAVGGGSAIDTAKAVAALLTNGGEPLDYMEVVGAGRKITRPAAPWIAVPTTAGTGAEVTKNAVIACPERRYKASIRGEQLLASAVIVDAELHVGVPPDVTASSGMDALCQLIESYVCRRANPLTDALAAAGIALAARSLRRAFADGADLDARQDMALAALMSGVCLTNAGLGAVHGFAAPLGANFPIPHGTVCAALLAGVCRANIAALRAQDTGHPVLARYAEVGRLLSAKARAADDCVRSLRDLAGELGIPRLGTFGLTDADVPNMVELAKKSSSIRGNPVELNDAALADVLREAI